MQSLTLTALAASAVFAVALPSNEGRDGSRIEITPSDEAGSMASNANGPNPGQVYVNGITYGGSGCPQGSVGVSFSPDRTTFTAIFDSFVASSGRGVPVTDQRKNCQVNLDLHYPQGWQYSIAEVDYRGFVALPAGGLFTFI